jgi:hypothetical protein
MALNSPMPMFTRRRLQAMLDESHNFLGEGKRRDLVARLGSKQTMQILGAEGELAMIWAVSRLGPVEVEPEWWGIKHPDILSGFLFKGEEAAIEIKCVSDGPIAGEGAMRRAVKKITDYANQIRPGTGRYLHFQFAEESSYSASGYRRRRNVGNNFELDDAARLQIFRLVNKTEAAMERITNPRIDVVIRKSIKPIIGTNYFCTMPSEFHSLQKNTVFSALEDANGQLRNGHFTGKRIAILVDAGCVLLRNLNDLDGSNRRVSGRQVIMNFLSSIHGTADLGMEVAVLRASQKVMKPSRALEWKLTVFDVNGHVTDAGHPLHAAIQQLPPPRLEGYQVNQRLEDRIFQDQKFSAFQASLSTSFHYSREGGEKLKFSSRLLMEFLAGNISESDFRYGLGIEGKSPFTALLRKGLMPNNVTLEAGGLDRDDDYIVLEFSPDPSVSPHK